MLSLLARTILVLPLVCSSLSGVQADRRGEVSKARGYDLGAINQRAVEDDTQGPSKKKRCDRKDAPCPDEVNFRFLNAKTKPFHVTSLPNITYNIGEMYSGLIPIDMKDPDRALFFVFQPTDGAPVDEVTIWLNGGPGCSSLLGFLQGNGRFTWHAGMSKPIFNPYSWVGLTNVLWVDQPVGAGFATGQARATSEEDAAKEFADFFLNFQNIFGISKFKIYLTGESYAGRYVPYISAEMLNRKDKEHFDVGGALMYDPAIGSHDLIQAEAVAYPYIQKWNNILGLNASFMEELKDTDRVCGYAEYRDYYLAIPANVTQPVTPRLTPQCDIHYHACEAAFRINPCFSPFDLNLRCPVHPDPLGMPTRWAYSGYHGPTLYFDRDDVKSALHAPADLMWEACGGPVFVGDPVDDTSLDSIQKVLPQVIEATNRVLIANSALNFVILPEGTLLAIQNMTWGGKLGFETKPTTPIVINLPDFEYEQYFAQGRGDEIVVGEPQGTMGVQHYERGLMWAETFNSGYQQAMTQPRSSFQHLQWLLGHIETL
ncbi:putative serine-type carboxypeptidase F [Diplocarpon rosae]|nr:putative serine-type carboxypeptidase F [Diplocarpon rosae]